EGRVCSMRSAKCAATKAQQENIDFPLIEKIVLTVNFLFSWTATLSEKLRNEKSRQWLLFLS
ncbi:hypothetical protein ABFT80_25360, partial [Mesorhizobium sp. SB112]|uniref:hypothetical protein n=1 Tax=Mesorhizobium sp. SB112 TaxID=3151853 RepID=UPI0032651091